MFARPRPASFAVSLLTHGAILAWVASGPVHEEPKSLYAQTIAPHSSKLVWYNFSEKLPDVSPAVSKQSAKPLRTEVKLDKQQIHTGMPKSPRAKQFVWQPAPKLELKAELKSPNVLAIHIARPVPPPQAPKPKVFVPPVDKPKPEVARLLPDAPQIRADRSLPSAVNLPGMHAQRAPARKFVAPREQLAATRASVLPDAPQIRAERLSAAANLPGAQPAKAPPRAFTDPVNTPKHAHVEALPDAPAVPESASNTAVSMAIVSLNPAPAAPAPPPEGSRDARLAAGPDLRKKSGAEEAAGDASLTVPGLLIRNADRADKSILVARAAPTSTANLAAAVRSSEAAPVIAGATHSTAVRVASSPDPHWGLRDTYAMSVQMPNVTSYTGSWMIWFAERAGQPSGGVLNPPVPLHKVDPKYYPAAMADRVEGTVRLAAIIRKDGRVVSVRLLEHLDDRLDQSAQDALDQWRFEPALLNGQPVDVDAVVEIPFRLAPRVPR